MNKDYNQLKTVRDEKHKYNDVWDYLSIPFENRSYFGIFYKEPKSLLSGQWKNWEEYLQKHFPVQYFFREVAWQRIIYVWWRIKDIKHYLKNRFINKTHIIKLPNVGQWNDIDSKIENALEILFLDFYNNEYKNGYVDWDAEPKNKELIEQIYHFLTVSKPEIQKQIDCLIGELFSGNFKDWLDEMDDNSTERKVKIQMLHQLEENFIKQHTEVLILIVKHRGVFWS